MNLIIKYFSIIKALSDGINYYFKNLKVLLPITAIVGLGTLLLLWFTSPHFEIRHFNFEKTVFSNIGNIRHSYTYKLGSDLKPMHYLGLILISIYKAFMINFGLKVYNNPDAKSISFTDFWHLDFDMFSYLLARLRYVFTCIMGIILLVIPGLVWIPGYYFAEYFIIDRALPVGESFAYSSNLAHGVKYKIWLFLVVKAILFSIFFTGFAPITAIIIYLMFYIPISVFSKISIYKQLLTPKQIA